MLFLRLREPAQQFATELPSGQIAAQKLRNLLYLTVVLQLLARNQSRLGLSCENQLADVI